MSLIIQPIANRREQALLEKLAAEDRHQVCFPTHLAKKAGELVGYASLFATPLVNVWLHSQRGTARDTMAGLQIIESLAVCTGRRAVIMPCAKSSPYFPLMDRLGFKPLGETVLFQKEL